MSTTKYPVRLADQTDDEKLLTEKSACCSTYSATFWTLLVICVIAVAVVLIYSYIKNCRPSPATNTLRAGTKIPSTITEVSSDVLTSLNSL